MSKPALPHISRATPRHDRRYVASVVIFQRWRKKITAAFDGGRIISDGGVMLLAAAERRLKLADRLAAAIHDPRDPQRVTHAMVDILRARIFAIACGYEDGNDID